MILKKDLISHLPKNDPWLQEYHGILFNMKNWLANGYITEDEIANKHIMDFGGAHGQLAIVLLELGAKSVTVVDPNIKFERIKDIQKIDGIYFINHFLKDYSDIYYADHGKPLKYDFIISHTVSEHLPNIYQSFHEIYECLSYKGVFINIHDNYYSPSGAHDNLILSHNAEGIKGYYGPKCWESKTLCEASEDFRQKIIDSHPKNWSFKNNLKLTPEDCNICPFKKRTKAWAHLIHQHEFNDVFLNEMFSTGKNNSALNKITPFQLRQALYEAGFSIEAWHRKFGNTPLSREVKDLLTFISEEDLKTLNIFSKSYKYNS